jgi:serine/threonine-protein kinase
MIVERREPEESSSTDPASTSFGFDSNTVVFVKEGIERTTANNISRKYKFVDLLKKGGMGRIFLVQEVLSGRFVALKVMAESTISSVPHVQQFVREAVITARLQHPHVIPVHDLGFVDGHKLYYTMRYVNGKSLTQLIGAVGVSENLTALKKAASAVHYAHTLGLWHRDLKPDNILVDRSGEVFVIDWGLVSVQPGRSYALDIPEVVINRQSYSYQDRLIEETESAITAYLESGERRVLIGTPAYMAPEQCANQVETMGQVSDVWAFGVMLYEILTGEHPIPDHKRLAPLDLAEHVQRLTIPTLLGEAGSRYPELSGLCHRMLAPSPADREPSLQSLIATVDSVLGSHI